jgi:hypothetical protein
MVSGSKLLLLPLQDLRALSQMNVLRHIMITELFMVLVLCLGMRIWRTLLLVFPLLVFSSTLVDRTERTLPLDMTAPLRLLRLGMMRMRCTAMLVVDLAYVYPGE